MARRMIPVRNRHTGDLAQVSERAYGYFAADFERLDQPAEPAAEPPAEEAPPATEAQDPPKPSRTPRPATAEKE